MDAAGRKRGGGGGSGGGGRGGGGAQSSSAALGCMPLRRPPAPPSAEKSERKAARRREHAVRLLRSVAEALWPALPAPPGSAAAAVAYWATSGAADDGAVARMATIALERSPRVQADLLVWLAKALRSPLASAVLAAGSGARWPRSFYDLTPPQRAAALARWEVSPIWQQRYAFTLLKKVTAFCVASHVPPPPSGCGAAGAANPFWRSMGYAPPPAAGAGFAPGMDAEALLARCTVDLSAPRLPNRHLAPAPPAPPRFGTRLDADRPPSGGGGGGGDPAVAAQAAAAALSAAGVRVESASGQGELVLLADAVVVGSGPGGSIAAAKLAQAGAAPPLAPSATLL
jgi:hypothetical protein